MKRQVGVFELSSHKKLSVSFDVSGRLWTRIFHTCLKGQTLDTLIRVLFFSFETTTPKNNGKKITYHKITKFK